ncbi:MAG: hypothetical protein A3J59_04885 [Candidatus Buchananbacteria bacterium RIFCSPHIGHO2_02_FULL_56_16]|uniref:4-hydroxy-tetrahydrodipicolinate synthase n=1 Tax=Candidatus Buchananbacteria bacterium RIFCSPHIGHO2_02_FULL_56_16 TaxID=1797542 RepID=A0A1G1YH09_9BACT|nr:MAG: hypothetical protein A3J59_04885 [Candidatus Buchananbacteria bacterium RIFCSPHIGHO2_02_FULL_56_16]
MKRQWLVGGVYTALVTPFTKIGAFIPDVLQKNIEFQISQGVVGLVPTGTTGESPTLEWNEHHYVIKKTVEAAKELFVLAGTGSNNTMEALQASCQALDDGADGVLILDPYYNKPASCQIRDNHHRFVAEKIAESYPNASVVIYIIPGRTSCKLEPVDLAILADTCPNIRAVKEATGDLDNMRKTRELAGPDFLIFSGDDNKTAEMMTDPAIRAAGVISVMGNIVPGAVFQMVKAFQDGDADAGNQIASALQPLFELVGVSAPSSRQWMGKQIAVTDRFPNPCPIKTMMAILGMDTGYCRPPLGPMSDEANNIVLRGLQEVWNHNPWVLEPIERHYGVSIGDRLGKASAAR